MNNTVTLNNKSTEFLLKVDNILILPSLKKVLNAIDGVSIVPVQKKTSRKSMCGLDKALDDVRCGRVHHADNVDDLFDQLLGFSVITRQAG